MKTAQDTPRQQNPVLFNAQEVRQARYGEKTQARYPVRPMRGQQRKWLTYASIDSVKSGAWIQGGWQMYHPYAGTHYMGVDVPPDDPFGWIQSPYGDVGDTLWVKERWRTSENLNNKSSATIARECLAAGYKRPWAPIEYENGEQDNWDPQWGQPGAWRPATHLPWWLARVFLRVTAIRVERLNAITETDAKACGFVGEQGRNGQTIGIIRDFGRVWDANHKDFPWGCNPWVWAITFVGRERP